MANPNPDTRGLAPAVRTAAEARALAALRKGGPRDGREKIKRQFVVYVDQDAQLAQLGVNKSELVRALLDEWLDEVERVRQEQV